MTGSYLPTNIPIALVPSQMHPMLFWKVSGTYTCIYLQALRCFIFVGIGAWNYIQDERTCPIDHMEVWDGISDARISFDAAELGVSSENQGMARLTENLNLQRGLLHLLDKTPDVDLIHQTKVASIIRESEELGAWPIVNLDSGRRLRARLLVS